MIFIYRCLGCGARASQPNPPTAHAVIRQTDWIDACTCTRPETSHRGELFEIVETQDTSVFNRRWKP